MVVHEGSIDAGIDVVRDVGQFLGEGTQIRVMAHPNHQITREQARAVSHKLAMLLNGKPGIYG